jgi:hypothetical protein
VAEEPFALGELVVDRAVPGELLAVLDGFAIGDEGAGEAEAFELGGPGLCGVAEVGEVEDCGAGGISARLTLSRWTRASMGSTGSGPTFASVR